MNERSKAAAEVVDLELSIYDIIKAARIIKQIDESLGAKLNQVAEAAKGKANQMYHQLNKDEQDEYNLLQGRQDW
jgi:hypothetical protein